jgi:hypothetical protein
MNFHLQIATALTKIMDEQFRIGKLKFGLDPILGLFPGFGDLIALMLSFYIIWIGMLLSLPQEKIGIMIKNVILDFLLGLIPVVGDISDVVYKANSKNLRIIHEHIGVTIVEGKVIKVA